MSSISRRLSKRFRMVAAIFVGGIAGDAFDVQAQEFELLPAPPETITSQINAAPTPQFAERTEELASLDESGVETLVRGPLHEAFAEPIMADPAPGFIIHREPPQDIDEVPPDYRPDGDRAIWISGYWGWDDQRDDFIWISGVFRIPPDGHRWVPGYWLAVDNGWQWVQGFWISETAETIEYLPAPPSSLEVGPSSPAPGPDYFYVPGTWSETTTASTPSVQWSPGYWHPIQDDFIWIPSHFVWTPRGCIYVAGYWDRRLPLRGLCFAPVYIPRTTYSITSWRWQPTVVLNSQVVLHNLFIQPGYNHYVFGDYYGVPFSNSRTVPAYLYHQRRGSFDPLISYYTAYNARQGHDLNRWYGSQFSELSRNPSKRPPHDFHSMRDTGKGRSHQSNASLTDFAYPLHVLSKLDGAPRISSVSPSFKQELRNRDSERKQLSIDRRTLERQPIGIDRSASASRLNNLDAIKDVKSLRLPSISGVDRKELKPLDTILKRPEPPRSTGSDRPNSGLSSRNPESNRSFGTNPSSERKPFSDWIQPLGQTPQTQKGSSPPIPSNQIRPASGLPFGSGNLHPNPTRSGSSRAELPRSEPLRSELPSLDLPRLELPRPGQSEDRNKQQAIPNVIPKTLESLRNPTRTNGPTRTPTGAFAPDRAPTRTIEPNRTPTRTIAPNRTPGVGLRQKSDAPSSLKPNEVGGTRGPSVRVPSVQGGKKSKESGESPRGNRAPASGGEGGRDRKGK
jgi:hypothetical protein